MQLAVDVDQAARNRAYVPLDGEAEADRVARGRVRVLADHEHAYVGQRPLEGTEDGLAGGEVRPAGRELLAQEPAHRADLLVDRGQGLGPVGGNEALLDESCQCAHAGDATGAPSTRPGRRNRHLEAPRASSRLSASVISAGRWTGPRGRA